MWQESSEQNKPLRTGLTTGTCATACSVASALVLLGDQICKRVSITLPKGKIVELDVTVFPQTARASTIKDAGDDPDITHGATIWAEVSLLTQPGITFCAGEGVGTVTKAGLSLEVGEPAINPVPRKMIAENLQVIAGRYQYAGGFHVTVGVENGESLAQKTMNPRLGILGGLSILGTTGIVRPFSCAAWIASIHQSIDVACANDLQHVAATTGNISERTVKNIFQLSDMALIEMGDFVGAVLKHLKKKPVAMLTLCGGFGKISKLANGNMDLHNRVSSIDFKQLSKAAANAGADKALQEKILNANTSIEALQMCQAQKINLGDTICQHALTVCLSRTINTKVNILAVDRKGNIVGRAASTGFGINL